MKPLKLILLASLILGLSACAEKGAMQNQVSRSAPMGTALLGQTPASSFNVQNLNISVPDSLTVSEANVYYPSADIVWRGDNYGERHQQVKAIFEEGMGRGLDGLDGNRAINIDIKVMRFHSLSERARYTVGGVHSITFEMTLHDAQTGAVVGVPKVINADFKALGGKKAVASEHKGITQKVRVLAHLEQVIRHEVLGQQAIVAKAAVQALAAE